MVCAVTDPALVFVFTTPLVENRPWSGQKPTNHQESVMPILFLLFLAVPIIEIWFLIQVGSVIGAGWTIVVVVATAIAGAALVRSQGLAIFKRIQQETAQGRVPTMDMLEGLMLLVAGAVLLTPGFFTDAVGFALLIPPVRALISRYIVRRSVIHMTARGQTPGNPSQVIDGDYRREND